MTIKQKFDSIDQSKLTADQKSFLQKIKSATDNFKSKDSDLNNKVSTALDNFIAKAKEKMPEAIKSSPAKAKTERKKPARTVMSVAKEIRKDGESWKEAQSRARQMMKKDSEEVSKTVETELDKLTKFVKRTKELKGMSGKTDLMRDASRKALPLGKRTSHKGWKNQYGASDGGRTYYENRANRADRGTYGKYHLAEGGYLTDPTFGQFQSQVFDNGGDIDAFTIRVVKGQDSLPTEVFSEPRNVQYGKGGGVEKPLKRYEIFKNGTQQGEVLATSLTEAKRKVFATYGEDRKVYEAEEDEEYNKGGALRNERRHVNHDEDYEVRYAKPRPSRTGYKGKRSFELGGTVVTDLAGHTGGSFGGDPTLLSGVTGTQYSGLVGETGAMSSGEMFAKGGALRNERKHVNHNEDYEVRYAKPRPSRTGYKGKRSFDDGGSVEEEEFSFKEAVAFVNESKKEKLPFYYNVYGGSVYYTLKPTFATPTGRLKGFPSKVTITKDGKINGKNLTYENGGDFQAGVYVNGGGLDNPRIYVADLEAYNSGRLVGEWLDLSDYNDADELMDAIQNLLDGWGKEEYAIHDYENLPSGMYSEYMGARDFAELYQMMDLAKENDLPLAVVQEVVSQFDESAVDEYMGRYDSVVDFSQQLVDDLGGLENFSSPEHYVYITNTDRRLIAGEEADNAVENARYENEFEDLSEEEQEEAEEKLRDEVYDEWYDGLDDPYTFLVEEQGLYGTEDFFKASFISVDYEKLARDLEQDYTFVQHDGEVYVFNIR